MRKNLRLVSIVVVLIALASVCATTLSAGIVIINSPVTKSSFFGGGACYMQMNCSQHGCHNNSNMTEITGVLIQDGSNFKIGSVILSFGCYNYISTTIAPYDFDNDGTIETILNELLGLVGTSITVEGYLRCNGTKLNVFYLNGILIRTPC